MHTTKTDYPRILKNMFEREGLKFETDEQWEDLNAHILTHKYFLGEEVPGSISWDDAVFSWYENVFKPLTRALWSVDLKHAFPGQSSGALYLAVSNHWYYLKERDEMTTPEDAVIDFVKLYGTGMARWFSRFLLSN